MCIRDSYETRDETKRLLELERDRQEPIVPAHREAAPILEAPGPEVEKPALLRLHAEDRALDDMETVLREARQELRRLIAPPVADHGVEIRPPARMQRHRAE